MIDRRKFVSYLGVFGAVGATGVLTFSNQIARYAFLKNHNVITPKSIAPKLNDKMCIVPTKQVEGPFFIKSPIRKNIIEDRIGIPINYKFGLVNADTCMPIAGAIVEIWQCDAEGRYSGYPEDSTRSFMKSLKFAGLKGMKGEIHIDPINEKLYLRGTQISDNDGIVEFNSIFPGWYEPRATHIHLKVTINEKEQVDIQYFFEQDLCDNIYSSHELYKEFGECPYTNENDLGLRDLVAEGVILKCNWIENNQILETSTRIGIKTV